MPAAAIQTRHNDRRIHHPRHRVARNTNWIDRTIVAYQTSDRLAVATKAATSYASIEILDGFNSRGRRAAIHRDEQQMLHAVGAEFLFVAFGKHEHLSVRAPFRPRARGAIVRSAQLLFGHARDGVRHK